MAVWRTACGLALSWIKFCCFILITDLSAGGWANRPGERGPLTVIKALLPLAWLFTVTNSELAAPTLRCPQIWRPHHWYMQLITFKWLFKRPGARLWNSSLILVTCLRGLWMCDLSCLRQGMEIKLFLSCPGRHASQARGHGICTLLTPFVSLEMRRFIAA